jgi:hypothetical protein
MLRTKTFEIKYHLTVIELCPGRASETIDFGQVVVKLQDIVASQRFGTSQRRARRARQTGGLARLIIQPSFD